MLRDMALKKTILLTLLLSSFATIMLRAQNRNKGLYIINDQSKVSIPGASMYNVTDGFEASADDNGFIDLKKKTFTTNRILVNCVGYMPVTIDLDTLVFVNNRAVIALTPAISSLREIKIVAASSRSVFQTISDMDIHLRPITNSQEVLRLVPGLFIGQHAGGGKAEQIFLRGFDIDHGTDIHISVDGMPVNMVSHAHGQGYADLHFVIPELIDKVNFSKGPYDASKGNFTTAGFVAFKTKDYLDNNFIKMEAGQFNSYRSIAGFNLLKPTGERRTQSLYVAGEGSYTRGYFESPQNFSRYNALLKYNGSFNSRHTVTALLSAFKSKWNASGQIPERSVQDGSVGYYGAIDDTEGGITSRYNASIQVQSKLRNGGLVANQLFYSKYDFELYSNFTFFKQNPVTGDQVRQKENRSIAGYNGNYKKDAYLGPLKAVITAGVQLRYDYIANVELTRTQNRKTNTQALMLGDINELNVGAYYTQQVSLNKKLEVTGGIRADHFYNRYKDHLALETQSAGSTILSPKLNIHYRINNKSQLFLLNGKSFHSNDTRVAVQQNGKKILPPAYGTDLGGIFKIGKKMMLQTALWYLWLQQEFVYVGDEGVVEPGGQTRRVGLDLSARYEVINNLYADLDISLANPRATGVKKGERYLPLAPNFTSVGGLSYRKIKGWNGSLRYRFMSNRPANDDNSIVAKGYFIADATVSYTKPKWEAGLSIQNLLNSKWKETQFETESRLQSEPTPVSEIHFTPGTPFFARLSYTRYW
jgi:TonB-dependent Receptor Plug Domain